MQAPFGYRLFSALLILWAASLAMLFGLADAARAQSFGNGVTPAGSVEFINRSTRSLYVAFSVQPGKPGPVAWSSDCQRFNDQILLSPGQHCTASVPSSAGPSRFCASENPAPTGKAPNCFDAQRQNLTMIETNFTSGAACLTSSNGCFGSRAATAECKSIIQTNCVYYDISIVPENCTNCDWKTSNCKESGGVSYNVPVQLSCRSAPTFTCRGPIGPMGVFHGVRYPTNCGTPYNQPSCVGGLNGACLQAYFYPMSTSGACAYPADKPQPIGRCAQGETLLAVFLDGQ